MVILVKKCPYSSPVVSPLNQLIMLISQIAQHETLSSQVEFHPLGLQITCQSYKFTGNTISESPRNFKQTTGMLAPQCSSLYVCLDFMGLSDSSRRSTVAVVPLTFPETCTHYVLRRPKQGHSSPPGHKSLVLYLFVFFFYVYVFMFMFIISLRQ